jgi:hypothetical protein
VLGKSAANNRGEKTITAGHFARQRDTTVSGHSGQKIAALRKEYHERDPEKAPAGKLTSACEWLELGYQGTAKPPPRL